MDAIERITQRIQQDAQIQVEEINKHAQNDVNDIEARYASLAKQERERILARGRKTASERLEQLNSIAGMEQRKTTLAVKQQLMDEAFELALDKLCSLPDAQRISLLSNLAASAARTGTEELIFSPEDRIAIGQQVVDSANKTHHIHLTLSSHTRPIRGGVIVSDGEVEVNCAFDTLVRLQRETLEKEVAQILFD